jgi:hypothetical protein
LGVWNQHELGLSAIECIADLPTSHCDSAALCGIAVQAKGAVAAWSYGTNEHTLSYGVPAEARPELVNRADSFMSKDVPRSDRVFALGDVDVGSADRGESDADYRFAVTGHRDWYCIDGQLVGPMKHESLHRFGLERCCSRSLEQSCV